MSVMNRASKLPEIGEPQALYAGVKQLIVSRIRNGDWPPRHRLPSENDLVRELGVSRMTINRALRELSIEGVIVRVQGVGSFVAEAKPYAELFEVRNIADEIAERGHTYSARVVLAATERAAPTIAEALGLALNAPVFHSIIVHHENDVPVQLEDRFVNPAAAPRYLEADFNLVTPNLVLSRAAPLTDAEHVVEAVSPSPAECRLLALTDFEPCLLIQRRTWSGEIAVTTVRLLYPGGRYRLRSGRTTQG